MKPLARFYFLLLLLLLYGCAGKSPEPASTKVSQGTYILPVALKRLDSLVNVNKASNNLLAQSYARKAYAFASSSKSPRDMVQALLMMGIAYNNYNNDSSFYFYSSALKLATRNQYNDIKAKIYYNIAQIYQVVNDTKMAVLFLDSSIFFASQNKNNVMLSNAYNAQGTLMFDMLDSTRARIMFDSSYKIAQRNHLPRQMGIAMGNMAKFESDMNISSRMLRKAIETLKRQPGNVEEIAMSLINLGSQSSNNDSAISYYLTAIRTGQSGSSAEVQIAAYNNLAYCYLDKHDLQRAEACLRDNAIPLAKQTDNHDWLSTLYDTYTDVLLAGNNVGKALEFERDALKARRKADDKQAKGQVRLLSSLLDLKNKELAIQVREREIQSQESKIHRMNIWFSISFAAFMIVILCVIGIFQRNKIRYQRELLNSAKRLLEIEEGMKGRVSMELHDLTTPFYTNMLHQIEKAQIKDVTVEVELKHRLSGMTESLRQISHRMNNSFMEQLTIAELVRGLCKDLNEISKVPIRCVIKQERFSLNTEETLHVYRMIQEMLTNGLKYVSAGEITVSLSEESKMFFILYQDSGSGFDMNKAINKGLGISNIFERAKIINGKAILNSFPGKGTKWTIFIPLKHEKRVQLEKALS